MHEQLLSTVEALRASEYPELDAGLVAEVLMLEQQRLDQRSGVLHVQLERIIDAFLRKGKS